MPWDWTILLVIDAAALIAAVVVVCALFFRDLRRRPPDIGEQGGSDRQASPLAESSRQRFQAGRGVPGAATGPPQGNDLSRKVG